MRSQLLPILLAASLWPIEAGAQSKWSLTLEAGATVFSSAAHDTAVDQAHLRPWRPMAYTLRLGRDSRRFGIALGLSYVPSGVGANVSDFVFVQGGGFELLEIAPELRYSLGTTAEGAVLTAHAGPIFDFWGVSGSDQRARYGGLAGATLSLPMSGAWRVSVRSDLALTGSYMNTEEEAPDLHRAKVMRRARLALGLTRQL